MDLRNRVAFATNHLAGALSFEYGTGVSFTTYLGWLMPYDARMTLVRSEHEIEYGIRDPSRIGVDTLEVADGEDPADAARDALTRSYPRVD